MVILVTALIAIIGWVFAIVRFHTERWWELKVSAYKEIIQSLYNLKHYFQHTEDLMDDDNYCPNSQEAYETWLKERESKKNDEKAAQYYSALEEKHDKAIDEIRENIDTTSFIIDKKATLILEDFIKKYYKITYTYKVEKLYEEMYQDLRRESETCLRTVIEIARSDLRGVVARIFDSLKTYLDRFVNHQKNRAT